jgi:hypothetical protein
MNISKAINHLNTEISSCKNLADAKAHLLKVLDSYQIQKDAGLDKIESFMNSIYTPSKKEIEKFNFKKTKKKQIAIRFKHIILEEREKGTSDKKIAVILNARYVHKKDYFNAMYINRFRMEEGIK